MSFSARMMVEKPAEIEMTLKVTMTMKEWEEFRDQLSDPYPGWKFKSAITQMLTDAKKIYYATEKALT